MSLNHSVGYVYFGSFYFILWFYLSLAIFWSQEQLPLELDARTEVPRKEVEMLALTPRLMGLQIPTMWTSPLKNPHNENSSRVGRAFQCQWWQNSKLSESSSSLDSRFRHWVQLLLLLLNNFPESHIGWGNKSRH